MHVGGFGEDVETDLPLARDGTGRYYIPGTSIAGALRQWCLRAFGPETVRDVWGFQGRGNSGHASLVELDDMTLADEVDPFVEIRDGVGIDRQWGVAAEHIKFDRAVLPRGTSLRFCMTVLVPSPDLRNMALAMLGNLRDALAAGRIRLGAAKSRGLGKIVLENARIVEQRLDSREGILQSLDSPDSGRTVTDDEIRSA
ncbi:MAG: hypothetical protein D6741_03740, partial [Planctomycetota bacterium]